MFVVEAHVSEGVEVSSELVESLGVGVEAGNDFRARVQCGFEGRDSPQLLLIVFAQRRLGLRGLFELTAERVRLRPRGVERFGQRFAVRLELCDFVAQRVDGLLVRFLFFLDVVPDGLELAEIGLQAMNGIVLLRKRCA